MEATDTILVVGGAGAQGAAVLRAIKARGLKARALVRSVRDVASALNAGAEDHVVADLTDSDALARAVDGMARVFLVTPFEADLDQAKRTAETVVAGLVRGGARHVVFNTGLIAGMPRVGVGSVDGKIETLSGLRDAGVPVIELAVTYYAENWLMPWASGRIAQGILSYPLASDARVSWLMHSDMGKAAAVALTRTDLAGRTIQLGGETCTPVQMTEMIAKATGRALRFEALPLAAFIEGGDAASGGARMGTAIGSLYGWEMATAGSPADVGTGGLEELGITPVSGQSWVSAQNWPRAL